MVAFPRIGKPHATGSSQVRGGGGLAFRKVALSFWGTSIPYDARWAANWAQQMHGVSTLLARTAAIAAICCIVVFPSIADAQVPNINIQETCKAAAGVMVN